jgi:hypothetical protein
MADTVRADRASFSTYGGSLSVKAATPAVTRLDHRLLGQAHVADGAEPPDGEGAAGRHRCVRQACQAVGSASER